MPKLSQNAYDAVIIGAGIGGLVCGCYLAKAGMKVLIAEQHHKPGGYCTSFRRGEFNFAASAHFLGGFRYGNLNTIFNDLGIAEKLTIKKYDPSNRIITPHYQVSFWADMNRTIKDFQTVFPDETNNIEAFFNFLIQSDPNASVSMRSWTFKDLLDRYFANAELKNILSFPLFGNAALPPSLISAFIGTKIFKEFLLDGGYYLEGGMQMLPDALAQTFAEYGGTLQLSKRVKKIGITNDRVSGIYIDKEGLLPADYVISNCDSRQTFLKLLGRKRLEQDFIERLNAMVPSLSGYVIYIGLDADIGELPQTGSNMWILPHTHFELEDMYQTVIAGRYKSIDGYLLYISPDKRSVLAFLVAPFKNKQYWIRNKRKLLDALILRIDKDIIPGFQKHIKFKDAATPQTMFRYTLNYEGAAFGWASNPSQLALPDFRKPSFVKGLYMTGHWTTKGFGIPGVMYVGHDTANMILRKWNAKLRIASKIDNC